MTVNIHGLFFSLEDDWRVRELVMVPIVETEAEVAAMLRYLPLDSALLS